MQKVIVYSWSMIFSLVMVALTLFSAGCTSPRSTETGQTVTPAKAAPSPDVMPTATITPLPLAALINDEPITLDEFQAELSRYLQAKSGAEKGETATKEDEQRVLDDLIDQVLLAQGAQEAGFNLDETTLQVRWNEMVNKAGGEQAFQHWLTANYYTETSFRTALKRSIAAAWMRERITAAVPETYPQVHARQILFYNLNTGLQQAERVLARLAAGEAFEAIAAEYDPLAKGDLGWFPEGYLLEPELEAAILALKPGEYSQVIKTRLGYHLVQLIEIDPQHPLDAEARWVLQLKELQKWLTVRRESSQIQILLP